MFESFQRRVGGRDLIEMRIEANRSQQRGWLLEYIGGSNFGKNTGGYLNYTFFFLENDDWGSKYVGKLPI